MDKTDRQVEHPFPDVFIIDIEGKLALRRIGNICVGVIPERGEVVLEKKHIYLGLKGRAVEIDEVKPENKRVMSAQSWIAGLHDCDDLTWNVLPEYYHKLPVYG